MEELNYIGELFGKALKDHKIEPSDKVWANIQKNIGSVPPVKPTPKFTKYLIGGAAVASVVLSTVAISYFTSERNPSKQAVEINKIAETKTMAPNQNLAKAIDTNPATSPAADYPATQNAPNNAATGPIKNVIASQNKNQTIPTIANFTNINNNTTNNRIVTPTPFIVDPNIKETSPISNVKENNNKPEANNNEKASFTLDVSKDTMVCAGEPFTIKAKGGTSVLWSNGSTTDEITSTVLNEEQELTYRAIITTINGDTTVTIKVKTVNCRPIEQPNAFTPNGDNKNDVFILKVSPDTKDFSLMIYDRSGLQVFETKDLQQGWDGKYNNENAAEGAYFYILRYRDKAGNLKTIRGTVVLLRP